MSEQNKQNADIVNYLTTAIHSFLDDPPDTPFQNGYLAAILDVYIGAAGFSRSDPLYQRGYQLIESRIAGNRQ